MKPEGKPPQRHLLLPTLALLLLALTQTSCATKSVVLQKIPPPTSDLLKSEQSASDAYSQNAQAWLTKVNEWLAKAKADLQH